MNDNKQEESNEAIGPNGAHLEGEDGLNVLGGTTGSNSIIHAVRDEKGHKLALLVADHASMKTDTSNKKKVQEGAIDEREPAAQDLGGVQEHEPNSSNDDDSSSMNAAAEATALALSISEIQDLPSLARTDAGPASNTFPGAYSITGRAQIHRPQVRGVLTEANQDGDEEEGVQPADPDTVIDGAVLVEEEEEEENNQQHQEEIPEVLETRVIPRVAARRKPRVSWFGMLTCFLLASFLVIPLAVILPNASTDSSNESNMEAAGETNPPTHPPFLDDLPTTTLKLIQDPNHGFFMANQWMWGDPYKDSYSQDRQMQRFLMASWYYTLNGDNWKRKTHWLDYNISECEWYSSSQSGEPICDEENWIKVFNVSANNLTGEIPATPHTFPHLRIFDISNNSIGGQTWFRGNDELEEFVISNNLFDGFHRGDLDGVGNFIPWNLRILAVDGNNFFAEYSELLGLMPKLEYINSTGNVIQSHLKKDLGNLRKLKVLSIAGNLYTGTIPTEWGKMTSLQDLDMSGNVDVHGVIPSEFGLMTDLANLDITETQLTGPLPEPWCAKVNNGTLSIAANCSLVQCCPT